MIRMTNREFDVLNHNEQAWDVQALSQNEWSKPVTAEFIAQVKRGDWNIHLTPTPLNKEWLGDVSGKRILCLASAGGQQGPTLAALGAEVTVYDLSREQLNQDDFVAQRDGLKLNTVQGDMTDLSCFENETFDLVFHPISNHYIADVTLVWKEAYRVLKSGGLLLSSFFNPVVFIADHSPQDMKEGIIRPRFTLPYADVKDLTDKELQQKIDDKQALVFGHTLQDLLGGQLDAGFLISHYTEDMQPNLRFVIDKYLSTFMATRAVKM